MTHTVKIASLLALLCAGNLSAAIISYTDRTAFLSAVSSSFENDFQALAGGPTGSPQSFSGNGFSYQVASSGNLYVVDIGGDRSVATNVSFVPLLLQNLGGGITAIGGYFYFNSGPGLDTSTTGSITVTNGVDPNATVTVPAPGSLTAFYGFISTGGAFTSLSFSNTGGSGFANFDDVIVGTAGRQSSDVPEPGTFVLVAVVLGGIGLRGYLSRSRRPFRRTMFL